MLAEPVINEPDISIVRLDINAVTRDAHIERATAAHAAWIIAVFPFVDHLAALVFQPQRMRIGWQNYRVYLTAGENSLYCGAARLTPSGWDIIFMGDAISCADGESVHVGNWCPGSLNKIIGQEIIFGRVDDPNIALLTIEEWGGRDWTKPGCENEKLRRLRTVTVEEFIEDGGCRYFLLDAREREENTRSYAAEKGVLYITGCDAMHREILRREIEIGANSLL